MEYDQDIVTASEIGEFAFCEEAWWLAKSRAASASESERRSGPRPSG
jgi:hypothetical protein